MEKVTQFLAHYYEWGTSTINATKKIEAAVGYTESRCNVDVVKNSTQETKRLQSQILASTMISKHDEAINITPSSTYNTR